MDGTGDVADTGRLACRM